MQPSDEPVAKSAGGAPGAASSKSERRGPPIASSKSICGEAAGGGGRPIGGEQRARPLMHSVSIVVELAQQKGSSGSSCSPPGTPSYCSSSHSCNSTSGGSSAAVTAASSGDSGCEGSAGASADNDQRRRLEKLVTSVGGGGGSRQASSAGAKSESVESEEEKSHGEEEDEEEEDCCLSSNLARRVVLVDEADKIFMRNRAQSADPHCAPAYLAELARSAAGNSTPPQPPPAPPQHQLHHSADLSGQSMMQPTRLSRRSRHSVATISPAAMGQAGGANWRASTATTATSTSTAPRLNACGGSPLAAAGSSELAERGELRQLSMRRNTHHQANFSWSTSAAPAASLSSQHSPLVMRWSGQQSHSTVADTFASHDSEFSKHHHHQLEEAGPQDNSKQQFQSQQQRFSALATNSTNRLAAQASACSTSIRPPPIQHRRQSLQINLLGSLARDSSRSLTEEELRGEREFNEQLRCAARSPDFFNALKHHHPNQQHQVISAGTNLALKRHNSSHQPARCQSTSGCWPALARDSLQPAPSSPTSSPPSGQVKTQPLQQQQKHLQAISPNSAAGRRRRVSFGSIDPIVLTSSRSPEPQVSASGSASSSSSSVQQQAVSKRQRASICSSLLSSQHQQQLGILRKLTATHQQQQQQTQLASRMAERESEIANAAALGSDQPTTGAAAQNSCPRRNRLASVGEPTAVAAASARAQDFQSGNPADAGETASVEPAAGRRHQSKSISSVAGAAAAAAPIANDDSRVRSIMANAKLRQEEFARLLEEHEQIVNEINKFETKISSNAAAAAKQQQSESGQL